MTYRGKIFKLPFPFTDLNGKKARPALAVSLGPGKGHRQYHRMDKST